ncbi:hypothetical protein HMPREF1868_01065 [Olsenella sp. DNF00959]|nr:hypothetical protein HMPREF1868_01065 [Olsenella sp. DNF00959]
MVDLERELGAGLVDGIHHPPEAGDLVVGVEQEVARVSPAVPRVDGADLGYDQAAAAPAAFGVECGVPLAPIVPRTG